jgi:hypothetical protein
MSKSKVPYITLEIKAWIKPQYQCKFCDGTAYGHSFQKNITLRELQDRQQVIDDGWMPTGWIALGDNEFKCTTCIKKGL